MNSHDKWMAKVVLIIFAVSAMFVGTAYDYRQYNEQLEEEYAQFQIDRLEYQQELNRETIQCNEDVMTRFGKSTEWCCLDFFGVRYKVGGLELDGTFYMDEYGCYVYRVPYVSLEYWKELSGKSYWNHIAKRFSTHMVMADDSNSTEYKWSEDEPEWFFDESGRWKCKEGANTVYFVCVPACVCGCCDSEGCVLEIPKITEVQNATEVNESIFKIYQIGHEDQGNYSTTLEVNLSKTYTIPENFNASMYDIHKVEYVMETPQQTFFDRVIKGLYKLLRVKI